MAETCSSMRLLRSNLCVSALSRFPLQPAAHKKQSSSCFLSAAEPHKSVDTTKRTTSCTPSVCPPWTRWLSLSVQSCVCVWSSASLSRFLFHIAKKSHSHVYLSSPKDIDIFENCAGWTSASLCTHDSKPLKKFHGCSEGVCQDRHSVCSPLSWSVPISRSLSVLRWTSLEFHRRTKVCCHIWCKFPGCTQYPGNINLYVSRLSWVAICLYWRLPQTHTEKALNNGPPRREKRLRRKKKKIFLPPSKPENES